MTPGQNQRVEVTQLETGKTLVADAIRFEPAGTRPPNGIWHFQVEATDDYDVYAIWRNGYDYSTMTPYYTTHGDGIDLYLADQRNIGETWMLMGTYPFAAGEDYQVEITDQANGTRVVADAVKLVPQTAVPRTASWSFQVPATGNYTVHATWAAGPDRASDAPFTVEHDGGSSTVTVNQRQGGGLWHALGSFDFTAGTDYSVTLADDANGLVVADALYVVPSEATNLPFTWTASLPAAGSYEVYARWPADAGRTTAAAYEIVHALGSSTVTLDQRTNGGQWVLLGTYDFDPAAGDAQVVLEGFANGTVAADAVRFVEAGYGPPAEVAYLHGDQLGRPMRMSDASASLAWDRTQTPFGETVTETGYESTDLRFPGQIADAESGLSYNYFRDYDPSLGRYLESDPVGLYGGLNTYGYVLANPLGWIDPWGLWSPGAHRKIIDNAFRSLPKPSRDAIKAGSAAVDSPFNQVWGDAAPHAMRNPGDSPGAAKKRACDFIRAQMESYYGNLAALEHAGSGPFDPLHRHAAYMALGQAMHPVMDSTSPAHVGWQIWHGLLDPNLSHHGDWSQSVEDLAHLTPDLLNETIDRMNRILNGEQCECVLP